MNKKEQILIVDDDNIVRESLYHWFEYEGYEVDKAENGQTALKKFVKGKYNLVLLDMKMPDINGLDLLIRMKKIDEDCIIILITAYASEPSAIKALKYDAFDYVKKPIDPDELSYLVKNSLEQKKLEKENKIITNNIDDMIIPVNLTGESKQMKKIKEIISSASPRDSSVLIFGESGTGKELIAKTIHINSKRKHFPFIIVNCEDLTETSFENELFGFEKIKNKRDKKKSKSKFEIANGGTIFFRYIDSLSLKLQNELGKLFVEKKYYPAGSKELKVSDFRIISSSYKPLEELINKKKFNMNLYNIISEFYITIPPLRDRREDIPILAYYFLKNYCLEKNKLMKNISPEALKLIHGYDWSGNISELKNRIENAVEIGKSSTLIAKDLRFNTKLKNPKKNAGQTLDSFEKKYIEKILNENNWNISKSAEKLNIDRTTLYNKIMKYDLSKIS
jgi:DNA-binding NtrC family response regulator